MREQPSFEQKQESPEKLANEGIALWTDNLVKLDELYKRVHPSEETEQQYAETRSGMLAQIDTLMRALEQLEQTNAAGGV